QAIGLPHTACIQCNRKTSSKCLSGQICLPYHMTCYTLYKPDENGELK
nr:RecName: Full=Boigatoxin-A [Boiga dendrophila]